MEFTACRLPGRRHRDGCSLMRDPYESLAPDGTIVTGASRDRVPVEFQPVIADVVSRLDPQVPLYLYGSVATGQAVVGRSDVDLLAIGLDPAEAAMLTRRLSAQHRSLAREVAIGTATTQDWGSHDEGYGNRVFLRHYCVWLAGPDPAADLPPYRGDRAAARGFNGDLPARREAWRDTLARIPEGADQDQPAQAAVGALARSIGRKTLVAVAGLVSVHDGTWTTDRARAASRWGGIHPELRDDLGLLLAWGDGESRVERSEVERVLDDGLRLIADQFVDQIGTWR